MSSTRNKRKYEIIFSSRKMMTSIRNACIYINKTALNTCLCKRQEKFILNYPLIDANMGVPIKACCDFNWNESCIIDYDTY